MLVGAYTDRYRAIFSLGPAAAAWQYGGNFIYCDPDDEEEIALRSPLKWLHCIESPMYVLEGTNGGNYETLKAMEKASSNSNIRFLGVEGHDHFSLIAPLCEKLAEQILQGEIKLTAQTVLDLK